MRRSLDGEDLSDIMTTLRLGLFLLSIVWLTPASAQTVVEGDVYLVMRNGDVKPAASNFVFLVPYAVVASAVSTVCNDRGRAILAERLGRDLIARKRLADSAYDTWEAARQKNPNIGLPSEQSQSLQIAYDKTRDSVWSLAGLAAEWPTTSAGLIADALTRGGRTAATGMKAHYRMDSIPAGRYELWARTTLYDIDYYWSTAIIIGDLPVHRDLDNTLVHEGRLGCHELAILAPPI